MTISADDARNRQLVGVLTIGKWDGVTLRRPQRFLVSSDDDARQLAQRITRGEAHGRLAVHITALTASHRARQVVLADVGRTIAQATAKNPTRRGWLWCLHWYTRLMIEGTE